jgi:hypothetical protein
LRNSVRAEKTGVPANNTFKTKPQIALDLLRAAAGEEVPLRTERHVPDSIATMRRRLASGIVQPLPRCPCCRQPIDQMA